MAVSRCCAKLMKIAMFILTLRIAFSQDVETQVDQLMEQVMKCYPGNPGIAIAMIQNGQVVLTKGYGVQDLQTKIPVTKYTRFGVASLSKAFTAALLRKQLPANNLTIYSDLEDILGHGFRFTNSIRTHNADIHDLLSHTLGIPRHNNIRLDSNLTLQNIRDRVQYLHSIHPFRTSFTYNNLMYGLAASISEKLGSDTWDNLIEKTFFQPLKMANSTFLTRVGDNIPDLSRGYVNDPVNPQNLVPVPFEFLRQWGINLGSTGIVSNAVDMTKWMTFHLTSGLDQNGVRVMDRNLVDDLHISRNSIHQSTVEKYFSKPMTPVTLTETDYAMGWKTGYYRDYKMLRHTGSTYGYVSVLALYPSVNSGVFVTMSGGDHGYIYRSLLQSFLSDIVLGETPWLNSSTICSFPSPWYSAPSTSGVDVIDTTRSPTHPVADYAGTYHNAAYGYLTVEVHTASSLRMRYGIGEWFLYAKGGTITNSFRGESTGVIAKLMDLNTLHFHTLHSQIHSLEVVSFETNDPPLFVKVSNSPHVNAPAIG